ncbi:MAG TPA: (2Fe-2S)-binding protein [Chloroflexota bacterium]|nr:(2Fe-2S)-binding protein [Chloroflexota bacterium]
MPRIHDLSVNGARVEVDVDAETPLLMVLRDDLNLTGSKIGCGEGMCGACTVLIDGEPIRSCITPVAVAAGKAVLTIEGIAMNGQLHPLQQAFLEVGAFQCGYCTPGMIMSGIALLAKYREPSEAEIIAFMQGNICRCGAYRRIIRAIQQAATTLSRAATWGAVR